MTETLNPKLGGYQIGELLGKGGMGSVFRALHVNLGHPVAVKFLDATMAEDPEFSERFLREARICAMLDHPGIVRVTDLGLEKGRPYLVMELLEGEPLRSRIKRGPIPQSDAIAIAMQVLAALEEAHRHNVIHRDVKPDNIFLCNDGRVKVMDFGIARAANERRLTGTGTHLGTPHYMSPEQVKGQPGDARSDLYSLGIVLYEMVTGGLPFKADTAVAILHMQVSQEPPALPGRFPPWLRRVVARSLVKDPAHRFGSAEAMRAALEAREPPPDTLTERLQVQSRGPSPLVKNLSFAYWSVVDFLWRSIKVIGTVAAVALIGVALFIAGTYAIDKMKPLASSGVGSKTRNYAATTVKKGAGKARVVPAVQENVVPRVNITASAGSAVLECPACSHPFSRRLEPAGRSSYSITCPSCRWGFTVDASGRLTSAAPIEVTCPSCFHQFHARKAGQVHCPKCKWSFSVDGSGSITAGDPIHVTCPDCEKQFVARAAGIVHCPGCGKTLNVNDEGEIAEEAAPPAGDSSQ